MNRAHFIVAATLFSTAVTTSASLMAQAPQAPPMQSVLAGKKFTPPVKGEALIEFTQPVTKRNGANVVTTIKVRNISAAPVARLQVTETWYDKGGQSITAGKGILQAPIQPQEVQTITITTPFNPAMSSNNWNFSHANGTVKVAKVKAIDAPGDEPKKAEAPKPKR
ncbi:MAG: hypothetical protein LBQ09_03235 [Acidobacteriaceae bacterium]|jgi:hypothetical protein|nr:hypothetical protein [Acidobacteriaceae bacterium]